LILKGLLYFLPYFKLFLSRSLFDHLSIDRYCGYQVSVYRSGIRDKNEKNLSPQWTINEISTTIVHCKETTMPRPNKYTDDEIAKAMGELKDNWDLNPVGTEISITYVRPSFSDAILFVNSVAFLAEKADHHPNIEIRFRKVKFSLSTHDAKGLTKLDFQLAQQIETLNYRPSA